MKQDKSQRRGQGSSRRQSSASAILSGKSAAKIDYTSYGWILLLATFLTITLVSFLFSPFTLQLDEIKNVLLMLIPPGLLIAALWKMDFSSITWKRNGALILLGLYFAWMWVSWLVNPYKLMGERVIWFNLAVATFTVVFAWFMNTEHKVRKTMIFFVTLGLISTVLGLFLYAGRYTEGFYKTMLASDYWQTEARQKWATLVYTLTSSHGDMYSFILNSDFYAAFLVMLIPISLSMFFVEQRTGYKILALASLLLMIVCLFLTNSNDSFIAMFAFALPFYFLVGWLYVKEWGLSRQFVLFFVGCMGALIVLIGIMMLPKLSATFEFKAAAFEGRQVLWGGGFWPWVYGDNLHGQHVDPISIIFGTGPGGYRHYFPWFRRPDFFDQQIANVTTFSHNFYLDILLETGLVGLILFIGFHVRVMADGFRQIRTTQSRTHVFYQLALMTGLVGIAVQNYSSPNNRWAVAGMMYWCLFGLSMGLASLENPPVPGENANKRIGNIPIYKMSWWASMALAALFFWRCVVPGTQFSEYWVGAVQNAEGLNDMNKSNYVGLPKDQRLAYLAEAMLHFEKAIEANPTFATSYYKLAHVYNQLGVITENPKFMEKAIATYDKLDSINANYSEVHLNLGIMYAQKAGTIPQVKASLQEEVTRLKQEMQTATGDKRDKLESEYGQTMEALKTLEGSEDEVHLATMKKSYDEMKQAAHQSLKPNTQYLTGSIGRELAMLYDDKGEHEKADQIKEEVKKYFRSIIEYKPQLEDLQVEQKEYYVKAQRSLLALAEETNKIDETIEVLKQMVHDNPDSAMMLMALLESYDRAGKTKEKLEYLETAVHMNPTDAVLRSQLADAYNRAGAQTKYINELRRVEVLKPDDPKVLEELQKAYADAGNTEKAKAYTDKIAAINPAVADAATSASEGSTTATMRSTGTLTISGSKPTTNTAATTGTN